MKFTILSPFVSIFTLTSSSLFCWSVLCLQKKKFQHDPFNVGIYRDVVQSWTNEKYLTFFPLKSITWKIHEHKSLGPNLWAGFSAWKVEVPSHILHFFMKPDTILSWIFLPLLASLPLKNGQSRGKKTVGFSSKILTSFQGFILVCSTLVSSTYVCFYRTTIMCLSVENLHSGLKEPIFEEKIVIRVNLTKQKLQYREYIELFWHIRVWNYYQYQKSAKSAF